MRVLVTGTGGQLGYDVMKVLRARKIDAVGADLAEFDITNQAATEKFIKDCKPDVVIHCSAYTAVDRAEDEAEVCYKVNVKGTENIAAACQKVSAKMVYISTDYVFPGVGEKYYEPEDATEPINVYGQTKLGGELAVKNVLNQYFIVRISWVFGKNGNNFIKTMLRIGRERKEVRVVSDQIGSPTYTADLAVLLCDMIETENYGVYHATNEGICSWAEFTEEIFRQAKIDAKVVPISSEEFPTKAKRPMNSRLSKEKLANVGFKGLPSWKNALGRYLKELE